MNVIIVDDEPRAIALLESYLNHFSYIELVGTFRNGLKAFEFISKEQVDVILLDINMPHISGISLSKMIPKHISIIFTTAYSEYAVESYEVHTVDYLVKPISLERFTKSLSRVMQSNYLIGENGKQLIIVKSGFETFRLISSTILFLVKEGNYITYYCVNQQVLARETIQESMEKLPSSFIQTHKSYIVNLEHIVSFTNSELSVGKEKIPMSHTYKNAVLERLRGKFKS